jgi:hypothetical protein
METIITEPFELRFDTEASTIMNGIEVFQTEEFVKINEEGDLALLRVIIPTELAIEKTFKITITAFSDQILENGFQEIDYMNN